MTNTERSSTLGIHFFYVALMLGLCIVLLATFNWTRLQGFTEYLSVAATVTSLVLGILAIIYGFVSSGTISQSLGSVESSASKFTQIAAELRAVLEAGQRAQARAEERTSQLHGLIDDMRTGLSSLSDTTERIETSLETIPERINNSKSLAPTDAAPPADPPVTAETEDRWNESELKSFVRRSSPIGRVALHAILVAAKRSKYVDFSALVEPRLYTYVYGFLIATTSCRVLELEYPGEDQNMKAVRLKLPNAALEAVLEDIWATRADSKSKPWKKIAAKYGPKIEGALVDGGETPDNGGDVI